MKKKGRIIALLIVLVVICAVTFGISRYQQAQEEIKASGETILSVATEDVTKLSWANESGDYAFTKDGDSWKYDGDEAFPVSTESIEEMLSIFNEFGAAFIIENVTDYAQYGLDEPIATIHIETADSSYDISLGDYSQMDEERYVSLGDGNAYLAVNDPLDQFDAVSDDLIDNDSIPEISELRGMDIITAEGEYTFSYEEESSYSYDSDDVYFAQIDGETRPLSTSNVDSYLSTLRALELTNFINYKATDEEIAEYGLDDPDLTLIVEYAPPAIDDSSTDDAEAEIASESFTLTIVRDPEEAAEANALEEESASEATASESGDADTSDDTTDADSSEESEEEEITAYARMGDSPIVYQITGDAYNALLLANYDDLRHEEVLTATLDEITGIDISLEGNDYTLSPEEDGTIASGSLAQSSDSSDGDDESSPWYFEGQEVTVDTLVSEIRAATVTEFSDNAPTDREEISLRVYLANEDFPTVDIAFYRYDGSSCLAKIDGESVGYVSRSDVVDIIEAVNAIVLGQST